MCFVEDIKPFNNNVNLSYLAFFVIHGNKGEHNYCAVGCERKKKKKKKLHKRRESTHMNNAIELFSCG